MSSTLLRARVRVQSYFWSVLFDRQNRPAGCWLHSGVRFAARCVATALQTWRIGMPFVVRLPLRDVRTSVRVMMLLLLCAHARRHASMFIRFVVFFFWGSEQANEYDRRRRQRRRLDDKNVDVNLMSAARGMRSSTVYLYSTFILRSASLKRAPRMLVCSFRSGLIEMHVPMMMIRDNALSSSFFQATSCDESSSRADCVRHQIFPFESDSVIMPTWRWNNTVSTHCW